MPRGGLTTHLKISDFDGDALLGLMPLEREAADAFEVLHPALRYLSTDEPACGTNITVPKSSRVIANTFLGMV